MAMATGKVGKKKDDSERGSFTVVKNAADLQRLKLEKLMKNPDKPVVIPERPKEKGVPHVPDFVRNVMGSSAGAGSGEFHVYRHLRRKEYSRQKFIQERADKDTLDDEYHHKIEENRIKAELETAKKRAKRLKKKNKKTHKRPKMETQCKSDSEEESDEEHTTPDDSISDSVQSQQNVSKNQQILSNNSVKSEPLPD